MTETEKLVVEAAADAPPRTERTQGENVARLLWAMLNAGGTMDFGWGWTRAVADAFRRAGLPEPPSSSLHHYKSEMRRDPRAFAAFSPDPELVEDLLRARA